MYLHELYNIYIHNIIKISKNHLYIIKTSFHFVIETVVIVLLVIITYDYELENKSVVQKMQYTVQQEL